MFLHNRWVDWESPQRGQEMSPHHWGGCDLPTECLGALPLPPQLCQLAPWYIDLIWLFYIQWLLIPKPSGKPSARPLPQHTSGPSLLLPPVHRMGRALPWPYSHTTQSVDDLREWNFPWFILSQEWLGLSKSFVWRATVYWAPTMSVNVQSALYALSQLILKRDPLLFLCTELV